MALGLPPAVTAPPWCVSRKAAFVNKGEVHVGEDLRTVIQQHTADAAVAFCSLSAAIYGGGEGGGVVADKAGHIWLLDDRHLGVLVKDQWLEPAAADGIDPAKIKHIAVRRRRQPRLPDAR